MSSNFSLSAPVAAGDTVLAAQYNNIRKDTVLNAGDFDTSAGSANAYTLASLSTQITAYTTGMVVKFKANFSNTATPTLNINGLGAKNIKKNISEDLSPLDIINGQVVYLIYDGTNFQILSNFNNEYPYGNFIAGENIDASTLPQAVYLKLSDQKIYKTIATTADQALFQFIGFVIFPQNVVTNSLVKVQLDGVVKNFTALSASTYFISNTSGLISSTPGTFGYQIGLAKSATELFIRKGLRVVSGLLTFSATVTQTITVGFRPSKITFFTVKSANDFSSGVWTTNGDQGVGISSSSTGSTGAWFVGVVGTSHAGTVSSITETGFDVTNTKSGAPANAEIVYVVEA